MSAITTRASERRTRRALLRGVAGLASAAALGGCITMRRPPPSPTQLQVRQMQSRDVTGVDAVQALRAVAAALQDEGYTIRNADTTLGLITADLQRGIAGGPGDSRSGRATSADWIEIGGVRFNISDGKAGPSAEAPAERPTVRRVDATANVTELGGTAVRIRIALTESETNNLGGVTDARRVDDPETYRRVFAKVDKALFLERNRL